MCEIQRIRNAQTQPSGVLAFSHDGKYLFSANGDTMVSVYAIE